MHVTLEIMRGAGGECAENEDEKAAKRDVKHKERPIRLASIKAARVHALPNRLTARTQHPRKQDRQDDVEGK